MCAVNARVRFVGVLAIAVLGAACVPEPANRASRSPGAAIATATPVPTPAGPTPTPSFVRPTPTPQPTFFVYTVVAGDNLGTIAKRFGTSGRSIAYWNRATYPSLDPNSAPYKPNYLVVGWIVAPDPEQRGRPGEPAARAEPDPSSSEPAASV